jgi:hypothetical protein
MSHSALVVQPPPAFEQPELALVDDARVRAEIARVRASGILGPPGRQSDLFDFLVERSMDERPPKEIEIGEAVFWRGQASIPNDSVARVYVHRLRRRLEEYYHKQGACAPVRLGIPKGEYRIVGEILPVPASAELLAILPEHAAPPADRAVAGGNRILPWAVGAVVALLVLNAVALFGLRAKATPADDIRSSRFWSGIASSNRPLVVVMGDFYMFGEYENQTRLKRLIHDPDVASKSDLMSRYLSNPDNTDSYGDLALQYLPSSSATVLAELAPLLDRKRPAQIVLASELTPERLKNDDVIYIGLLSGLGILRDRVFSHSRFEVSDNREGMTDLATGKGYVSETLLAAPGDTMYRDYGFVSTFEGPSGNRIVVISGTHDTGLMGASESLTQKAALGRIDRMAKGAGAFEGFFEVKGQKHVNLKAEPLVIQPLDTKVVWSASASG